MRPWTLFQSDEAPVTPILAYHVTRQTPPWSVGTNLERENTESGS